MTTDPRAESAAEARRYEEAIEWFRKLKGTEGAVLSAEDLQAWERFAADPENGKAFEIVRRTMRTVPRIRRPRLPSAEELALDGYDGSVAVADWDASVAKEAISVQPWRSRRGVFAGVALSVVCAALFIALLGWRQTGRAIDYSGSFATGQGQQREVSLPDGSRIAIGARTGLSVHFSDTRRTIVLEHGEALFTVAHNRTRPFEVRAAGGTVTAIGTQFNVRRDVDRVTVTVTDGTVEVAQESETPAWVGPVDVEPPVTATTATRVKKGQQLTFSEGREFSGVESADLRRAMSWPQGRLEYRRTPLKDVVADVNRYFNREIILGDTAAGELAFSGTVFRNQSVEEWVRTLEAAFDIRVTYMDPTHILIHSPPETDTASRAP